jgi:ankyrin repeat protein
MNQFVLSRSFVHDAAFRVHDAAARHLEFMRLTRQQTEYKMIKKMRETKRLLQRAKACREKLRVVRLLSQVSDSGHTAASWAASLGAYEFLDELLKRGSTVGFTVKILHLTATYIQQSYRLYRKRTNVHRQRQAEEENPDLILVNREKGESMEDSIGAMFTLKESRDRVLTSIIYFRQRIRFPVPEAAYMGKWEIIQMIQERGLLHYNFTSTWTFPAPPAPFVRVANRHNYDGRKIDLMSVIAHGMSDLSAGQYSAGIGWVLPGDERESYGETQQHIGALWTDVQTKRTAYRAMRADVRARNVERRRQEVLKVELEAAMKAKDFRRCMELAQTTSVSIDYETPEGLTTLMAAAEENISAVDHVYMTNDDDVQCLAVAFLLDRDYYRPAVNIENKLGHTALIRACILNRPHVLQALLDRGAEVNRRNKLGMTAMHYSAIVGTVECTRLLLERGGDPKMKDNDGMTPFDEAEKTGSNHILKLISQYNLGFLGLVKVTRGYIVDTISCPLGCGTQILQDALDDHLKGMPNHQPLYNPPYFVAYEA